MRITIACPEALIADGRHLAMVLGYGPADADTYQIANWCDSAGNRYACASTMIFGAFIETATTPLERPEWDVQPFRVNMVAAIRAQSAVALGDGLAAPGVIRAVVSDDPQAALAIMGVALLAPGD